MFKKVLFRITTLLGRLYGRFNSAYNQTYSDKKTGKDARYEIEERKKQNKQEFIDNIATLTMLHAWSQDKVILKPEEAIGFAEHLFEKEKSRGNIDELNKLKGFDNE